MRAYATILIAVLLVGCVVYLLGQLILYRAGETMSAEDLVSHQHVDDGLYFGTVSPVGFYKLAAYRFRKPDIVILGSSRAHRQHQEFYNRPSYSMSGLVVTTDDAVRLFDLLLAIHKPQFIVYNLDFYSLCRLSPYVGSLTTFVRPTGPPQGGVWQPSNRFSAVPKLITRGVISPGEAAGIAVGAIARVVKGVDLYGLIAITRRLGFRLDGAIAEIEAKPQDPAEFEAAKQDILIGRRHYPVGCIYDPAAAANLEFLRQGAERAGIKLTILLPPIAPAMYEIFITARDEISGYYKTWLKESATRQFPDLHDLLDGRSVGATDSEFPEEVHGGDVSEARMLLKAAAAPGTALAEIVDVGFLQQLIHDHAGEITVELSYFKAAKAHQPQTRPN